MGENKKTRLGRLLALSFYERFLELRGNFVFPGK